MQQVIQPIDGRATEVVDIPTPVCGPGRVLVANRFSLVSAGTERHTVELARQPLWQKARRRPDHVRRVLEKVRQEGFWNTVRQVRAKLGEPMPLGYSSAGVVLEVGDGVREFQVGDRVASNGPHAGVVCVPKNLCARVPDAVSLDKACYAVLGSIALQGVRLAKVGLGDVVAVIGLGLVGQLAVALLKSSGCVVLGTDPDPAKRALAETMGADAAVNGSDFPALVASRTGNRGADAV
ncbi:MAG: zinc-dependent alcohol dehydrogenase, partial [Planctomycetia bacterium]